MSTAKSMRIYDILPSSIGESGVWFVQMDDDNPGQFTSSFRLEYDTWDHMGRPEVLTITIQPGDQLNGPHGLLADRVRPVAGDTGKPVQVRTFTEGVSAADG